MSGPIVLGITIRADGSAQVTGEINRVRGSLDNAGNSAQNANRSFAAMAREALGLGSALKGLAAGLSAVALYQSTKDIIMLADKMTLLDSRIKKATTSQKDYINSSKELVAISLRTGTSFEANATIFSRINKAVEDMGGSIRNTTALTETLAQTMRISGASAGESTSTIRQLSQALSSGVLRGDEFNSMMENAPRLAQALADGMRVNIGSLRAMAEAGELSSKRVIEAIQSQGKVIDDEFKRIPLTVGAAMENISTAFGQYAHEANTGAGATAGLAQSFNLLSQNLTPIIDGIVTLGKIAVTVFAGQMVISIGAYAAAKYAAITIEYAHAAALTMDIERTVALTAAQLAATSATVASIQATLASTTAMGARMAITNQLNIALIAQAEAQAANTAAMAAGTTKITAMSIAMVGLNAALVIFTAFPIKSYLEELYTGSDFAAKSMGALATWIEEVSRRFALLKAVFTSDTWDEVNASSDATKQSYINLTNEMLANNEAARNHVAISGDMQSALESLKSPQEVYAQKVKDTQEALKANAISQTQATGLLAKYKETLDQANAAAANAQLSDAGKEIVKLKDKYDQLTLSVEDYNLKHAQGIKGAPDEIAEVAKLSNAIAKLDEGKKALTKSTQEVASEAKKAAHEEETFWQKALGFLKGQAEQLNLLKLSGKEKALETEISRNLNTALGEAYEKTKVYTEAKQNLINETINNTQQIFAETEAQLQQAEALKRVNEAQDEYLKQQQTLEGISLDTQLAAKDIAMAKELRSMGAANEYIKQRIDLEQKVRALQIANPGQSEQSIRDTVIAQQRVTDELAQYTDNKNKESAQWMEAAYKKAIENIQDSFADMFENMLNGDAMGSFTKFADNIRKTLNQAISQQLALDLQNLFSENGSLISVIKSGLLFAFASIPSFFQKSQKPRELSPNEQYQSQVVGTGAMHIAETFSRDIGYEYQSKTILEFNNTLKKLGVSLVSGTKLAIEQFGSQLARLPAIQQVTNFFKPVTEAVSSVTGVFTTAIDTASNAISSGISTLTSAIGLTATSFATEVGAAWSLGIQAASKTFAGSVQAADAAAANGASVYLKSVGKVIAIVAAMYEAFNYFSGLGDMIKRGNVVEMVSKTGMLIGAVIAIFNPLIGVIVMVVAAIVGLFAKFRAPNIWLNTYNEQGNKPYEFNPDSGIYNTKVGKSGYIGRETPFGMTVFSSHEMSLGAEQMKNLFGELLDTIYSVDVDLANAIKSIDAKMGETGKTMGYYNNLLRDGENGVRRIGAKQNADNFNAGNVLTERYDWIVNKLAESGSKVGVALNAWFDVLTSKFLEVSKDNTNMVLGTVSSLASNLEDFMAIPLSIVKLIGDSVKSVKMGGTPDGVVKEIANVLNTFGVLKLGLEILGMKGDQEAVNNGVGVFLGNLNAIGFAVQDSANNLIAYGIAVKKTGNLTTDAVEFMAAANAKFASLKSSGLDNNAITAYFGSFGLMANLFAEAGVEFKDADLDAAAMHLHKMAASFVEVAKNTIDHAIANEKLTNMTRESAIATLIKSGKLEEATVAEAEYGVAVQNATKDMLDQMGFIQQLGFITGNTLGAMGVSADTWVGAAKNVVNVFGDMEKAMSWLDTVAKAFLSPRDYAQYNLSTVNRGLANLQETNPALKGITSTDIAATLNEKTGKGMATFIAMLAQAEGAGAAAATVKQYVDLLMLRMSAEKALADVTASATDTTAAHTEALKANKDIQEQIDVLRGRISSKELSRAKELGSASDATTRSLLKLKNSLEDIAGLESGFNSKFPASQAQQLSDATTAFTDGLTALGIALPATADDFKALVEGFKPKELTQTIPTVNDFGGIALPSKSSTEIEALGVADYKALLGLVDPARIYYDARDSATKATTDNSAAIANERKGLQDQLDQLTMTNTQLLEKQRNALDESNRALFDQVQIATKAKAIADERQSLQEQLDQLALSSAQLLSKQRGALDESNRALFDQVQLLKFQAEASAKAAEAQKTLNGLVTELSLVGNAAGQKRADRFRHIKDIGGFDMGAGMYNQIGLTQIAIYEATDGEEARVKKLNQEVEILNVLGMSYAALLLQREEEKRGLSFAAQAEKDKFYAAQDAAKTRGLEKDLLTAQGNTTSALNLTRQEELNALSPVDQAIKRQIYALQDLATAHDKAAEGVSTAMSVLQKSVDAERKTITERYNAGIKTTQDAIDNLAASTDKLKGLSSSLLSFLDKLVIPGNEAVDRANAQARIATAIILAKTGGVGAINNQDELIKAVDVLGRSSENLFSTQADYLNDQYKTAIAVNDLSQLTDTGLSTSDKQLKALQTGLDNDKRLYDAEMLRLDGLLANAQAQIDAVNGTTVAVMSVSAAIDNLSSKIVAQATVQTQQGINNPTMGNTAPEIADHINGNGQTPTLPGYAPGQPYDNPFDTATSTPAYQALTPDIKANLLMNIPVYDQGTINSLSEAFGYNPDDLRAAYGVSAFASGGEHAGGWRIVGENGPELEKTGPSRIFSNPQSKSLVDNSELIAEIKALREEVAQLRASAERGNENTRNTADILSGRQSVPILVEVAS